MDFDDYEEDLQRFEKQSTGKASKQSTQGLPPGKPP